MHVTINPDDEYELEVTLTFAVPVSSTLPMDPHEMATHMRDTWMSDEGEFAKVLTEANDGMYGDLDLQVRPTTL
jgi:hypothetical protein